MLSTPLKIHGLPRLYGSTLLATNHSMSDQHTPDASQAPAVDENQLMAERREKLKTMRERQAAGQGVAFPNDFKPAHHAATLHELHGDKTAEVLTEEGQFAKVAGRMMLKRVMGKASFATLQDATGRIQVYVLSLIHI